MPTWDEILEARDLEEAEAASIAKAEAEFDAWLETAEAAAEQAAIWNESPHVL